MLQTNFQTFLAATLAAVTFIGSANADLIGHWPFDEGTGTIAADSSPAGNDGVITNGTWGSDATRASYISFDGSAGSLMDPSVTLPAMSATTDFTWAFWANSQEAIGGPQQNAVIIGNRKDGTNTDYTPRQFIKFTPTKFEWHQNGNGNDNVEYDDLVVGEWNHHAVVKTGTSVQYYRDGAAVGAPSTLAEDLSTAVPMAFFVGGDLANTSANENFNGFIDDVRIYDMALTPGEVAALVPEPSSFMLAVLSLGILFRRKR